MATFKNTAVVVTFDSDAGSASIQIAGGEGYGMDIGTFRQQVGQLDRLHLLLCLMTIKLENAGIDAETASLATLQSALDGNYKI